MIPIRNICLLIVGLLPIIVWSQNNMSLKINEYHATTIKLKFVEHPLLSESFKSDSTSVSISVFTRSCIGRVIMADSIQFYFTSKDITSTNRTSITIIPDTLTTFSSHIFAYGLYEGAEIFTKFKKRKNPLFTVGETDILDSLLFLDQRVDNKGQIWYQVQFKVNRHVTQSNDSELQEIFIKGWMLRGRTRLSLWGWDCN